MQMFSGVHNDGSLVLKNSLFVLCLWTAQGWICYSATHIFPMWSVGAQVQNSNGLFKKGILQWIRIFDRCSLYTDTVRKERCEKCPE